MSSIHATELTLQEHGHLSLPREFLTEDEAFDVKARTKGKVTYDPPSRTNGYQWVLRADGVVGVLELRPGTLLRIEPKVGIANLFRMIEIAEGMREVAFDDELVESRSINDLFEMFAILLARKVLSRSRRGFLGSYAGRAESLIALRGRVAMAERMRRPQDVSMPCEYEEFTGDVEDNRILSWALFLISRSAWCGDRSRPIVRKALHSIAGIAPPVRVEGSTCVGRTYHRLNLDYEPMHALARFFIERCGPAHQSGECTSLPFLVDMPGLFEAMVRRWLQTHLPVGYRLQAKKRHDMSSTKDLYFEMDLVLYEEATGTPLVVIDTKYKARADPDSADLQQVIAYAAELRCREAMLVYPSPISARQPHRGASGIRVHCGVFDIARDLHDSGSRLRSYVLDTVNDAAP